MKFCKIKVVKKALIQYNSNCSRICLLVFAFFLMSYSHSIAQINAECFEGYYGIEGTYFENWSEFDNLEDTFALHPWVIDSTINSNLWQIGIPQKIFLDSAYSAPNALITDTTLNYPINNYSTFYEKFCDWPYPNPMYLNTISIAFRHKFQTDTLHDGLYIELSYDNGNTWSNIINSDSNSVFQGLYSIQDTLFNGTPGFSGNSSNYPTNQNGWKICDISLTYFEHYYNEYESVMFRFVFISDSINDNMEGWLIDDLYIGIFGWWNNIEDIDNLDSTRIFPNPASEKINITFPNKLLSEEKHVTIIDEFGTKIFEEKLMQNENEILISDLKKGFYLIKIHCNGFNQIQKLIIN